MTDQLAAIPEGRAERIAFWTRHIEELAQSTLSQRATVVLFLSISAYPYPVSRLVISSYTGLTTVSGDRLSSSASFIAVSTICRISFKKSLAPSVISALVTGIASS